LRRFVTLLLAASATGLLACGTEAGADAAPGNTGRQGGTRGGGRGGRGVASDRPTPVEVEMVRRGSVSRTSTIAGILEPIRTVGVNAQLGGVVLSVRVEEGNRVAQGQVLAELDTRELQAQARSAAAALKLAQSNFDRSEQLFRQQIITVAEHERDRAALESARATLEGLETRLGYATVAAPTSGIVTEKRVEAGDVVSNQTRLFAIADVSMLVTRVQVSELEVTSLTVGDRVPLTVDALGAAAVDGRIRRIFPAADSATRLVPVEVALTGRTLERLRPGYTVRATFALDRRDDALLVPSRAVSGPAGARAVYVVHEGKIERRGVRVGPDMGGQSEVFEGVTEGDSVIVSGTSMVREGATARVVPPLGDQVPKSRPVDSLGPSTTASRRGGGSSR
jgi:RND family efflux transporter MFP subunit